MREFKTVVRGVIYQFSAINESAFKIAVWELNKKTIGNFKPSELNVIEL